MVCCFLFFIVLFFHFLEREHGYYFGSLLREPTSTVATTQYIYFLYDTSRIGDASTTFLVGTKQFGSITAVLGNIADANNQVISGKCYVLFILVLLQGFRDTCI